VATWCRSVRLTRNERTNERTNVVVVIVVVVVIERPASDNKTGIKRSATMPLEETDSAPVKRRRTTSVDKNSKGLRHFSKRVMEKVHQVIGHLVRSRHRLLV